MTGMTAHSPAAVGTAAVVGGSAGAVRAGAQVVLDVRDVTVRFGGVSAVRGASLTAAAGRVTGLIGPNGAGKTTLFNVVTGLQAPSGGQVLYCGRDITARTTHERARGGIARTFQRLEVFGSLSVWENVSVAAEIHAAQHRGVGVEISRLRRRRLDAPPPSPAQVTEQLLHRVGLAAYAYRQADTVPTGIARLVELARALALDPLLLLLDEPSSGLSSSETAAFGALISDLAGEGRAVLIVEHDMDLIMGVCDHIHVLNFGQIIASGTPAQIRADEAVQRAYLGQDPDLSLGADPDPDGGRGPAGGA